MRDGGDIRGIEPGGAGAGDPAQPDAPRADDPAPPPVSWGRLAILARLGEDHFGGVFLARDPALGRDVTLRLRPADPAGDDVHEARFLDEAKRLAAVRHPSVLLVHGAERRDGYLGMWSDRSTSPTLEELLVHEGPLAPAEVRRIGLELCQALTSIHSVGIIHREVRTTGVVREEGGRIVLQDSGSLGDLRRRADDVSEAGIADALALALAPEQLMGVGVNLSTDVYGLGVLLYRLACGRYPVEAESVLELSEHHNRRLFEPLRDRRPELPLDFARVIEKAIDPEPARRYPNAVAFERALGATLLAPMAAAASAPAPGSRLSPALDLALDQVTRWRSAIFSTAAFALGCLVAAMLIAEPSPSRIAARTANPTAPAPEFAGPPIPAALAARLRLSTLPSESEPERWAYKQVPRTSPYGPPTQRAARAAAPSAKPLSGPVAGATAVLRALAQGPSMSADAPVAVDPFGYLTLTTVPEHARVTIDGVLEPEPTNATYRIEPGQHWVRVEKLGYQPQELPPIDLVGGQKLRAGVTLAAEPPDSLGIP